MTSSISLQILFLLLALLAVCLTAGGMILYKYWILKRGIHLFDPELDQLNKDDFYRIFFDSLPDGFLLIDDLFTIVQVNDAYCRMTRRSREEVVGKRPPFPGWPKTNWGHIEDRVKEILAGIIKPFETAMYRSDGSSFPGLFSVSRLFSKDDRTYYSVILRDISDRVAMEQALRSSEAKFRAQFMGLPIPLYTWQKRGDDFVLIDHNDAANRVTYGKMADFVGMPASEMYREREDILADLHRCYDQKMSFQRDMIYEYMSTPEAKHLSVTYAFVPPDYILVHTEDRTARVEAREKLEASEARLRTVVEHLPFGFFMIDEDGRYSMVNNVITQQWGANILGKTVDEVGADEETLKLWKNNNRRAFAGESIHEEVSYTVAGEKRNFYNIIAPVHSGGRVASILGVNIDITDQRRVEQELHESDTRLRLVAEQLPAVLWTVDHELRFTSSIGAGLDELRLLPGNVVGMTLYEYFGTDDPEYLPIAMHRKSLAGHATTYEIKWDGRTWEAHTEPLRDSKNEIIGCLAIALDITSRKQVEELREQSRLQLRALAGRMEEVREEESTKIARRIHDDLGQSLTGIRWDITRLGKRMQNCSECDKTSEFLPEITKLTSDIDATIKRVREISAQLRPLILDDLGLLGAFEWQIQEFQKSTDIQCEFDYREFDEKNVILETQQATVAFRILQEILNNVRRHANAHRVWIKLGYGQGQFFYTVRDDGKGMSFDQSNQMHSLGILGMRERAQSLHGEVRIESAVDKGTTVHVTIPI